jgi:hypothetical protein
MFTEKKSALVTSDCMSYDKGKQFSDKSIKKFILNLIFVQGGCLFDGDIYKGGGIDMNFRSPTKAEWEDVCRERGKNLRFGTGRNTIGSDDAHYDAKNYKEPYSL